MNVKLYQALDKWFGCIICFCLSLIRAISFGSKTHKSEKIVFVKLVEKGTTILASNAFRKAAERVGRDNIYLITFEDNKGLSLLLDIFPEPNIITIRENSLKNCLSDISKSISRVKDERIDTVIDLEFFSRMTASYCYLLGARTRVGFHAFKGGPYRGNLFTHRLLYTSELHTRQSYDTMIEALDCNPEMLPSIHYRPSLKPDYIPSYSPDAKLMASVKNDVLTYIDLGRSKPFILMNPYPSDELPSRKWPEDRYAGLAKKLLEHYDSAKIGLIGTKEDEDGNESLRKVIGSERCLNLAGKTKLEELLTVFHCADLLITSDGGTSHLASLTPLEVITMFGPETPRLFAAETDRNHVVFAGLACSPSLSVYTGRKCVLKEPASMEAISVDEVYELACKILKR